MRRRQYLGVSAGIALVPGCLRLQEQGDDSQADQQSDDPQTDETEGENVVGVDESSDEDEAWREQRFDRANTAYNPDGTVPRDVPEVLGRVELGVGLSVDGLLGDGSAYFLTENATIVAIDSANGEQQWTTESVGPPLVPEAVVTSELVAGRAVDGTVYGVNRADGTMDGEFPFGGQGLGLTPAHGDVWVAPAFDGWVRGINPPEQTIEWEEPVGGVAMRPAVGEEYALVSVIQDVPHDEVTMAEPDQMDAEGLLYVIDVETGERVAQASRDRFGVAAPVIGDGSLLWAGFDGDLVSRNRGDGDELWRFSADAGIYRSPVLADGVAVVGTEAGNVYGVDTESGDEEWSYSTGGRIRGGPVGVDGTVLVGSDDSSLYALDIQSGTLLWEFDADAPVRSVVAGGDRVYAGTTSAIFTLGVEE